MDSVKLRQVDEHIENLPSIGEIEQQIIRLIESNADFKKIANLMVKDPLMATRVLGLANSPFYGLSGKVSSVALACTILGAKTLHSYILSLAFFGSIKSWLSKEIVRHSFQVAMLMQFIANRLSIKDDSIFVIGLLHDIGKIYIAEYYTDIANEIFTEDCESEDELINLEIARLGFHHVQMGVLIARHWALPDKIINVINQQMLIEKNMSALNKILSLADVIAEDISRHQPQKSFLTGLSSAYWEAIGVEATEIRSWYPDFVSIYQLAAKMADEIC